METNPTLKAPSPAGRLERFLLDPAHAGPLLLGLGLAMGLLVTVLGPLGLLPAAAAAGLVALVLAYRHPILPLAALILIVPFNYGFTAGGATTKLSELVVMGMVGVALTRMAALDREVLARLRSTGGWTLTMLLLGALAIATAIPHPHAYNVRYDIFNYIAFVYAVLFFRRGWWPWLLWTILLVLALESAAALVLKFVFGMTGTNLFDVGGGVKAIQLGDEVLEGLAGGRFRLAGTLTHKNLLAAFYVLLLPVVGLEILRWRKLAWLAVFLPALAVLMLTDSMTGWGATALIVAIALIHLRRFDYLAVLTLLVFPLAAIGLYEFGASVFYRVQQLLSGQEGWGTVSSRGEILRISRRLIEQYPFTGIGRNNFLYYGKTHFPHAHNLFVMKAIEMGVPAGLGFAGLMLALMARPWRAIARESGRLAAQLQYYRSLGLWLGCLGFVAMNLFDYSYSNFGLGPLFMALLGILLSVALDLEECGVRSAEWGGGNKL